MADFYQQQTIPLMRRPGRPRPGGRGVRPYVVRGRSL